MKKTFLALITGIAALTLTSCEKEQYLCVCKVNGGGTISTQKYELGRVTNNSAQKWCSDKQLDISYNSKAGVASCEVLIDTEP